MNDKQVPLFKSYDPVINVVLQDQRVITFRGHQYAATDPTIAAELMDNFLGENSRIYIDPAQPTVAENFVKDPVGYLMAKQEETIEAKLLAKLQAEGKLVAGAGAPVKVTLPK
jgi:hypothetical protein